MFFFRRKSINNSLVQLINSKKENLTVKELLSNSELSISVRNEIPELLNFFSLSYKGISSPSLVTPQMNSQNSNLNSALNPTPIPSSFELPTNEWGNQSTNSTKAPPSTLPLSEPIPNSPLTTAPFPGIRGDSGPLLAPPNKILKNQEELASLALSSKLNKTNEQYIDDIRYHYNRNAANLLAHPSRIFHERLTSIDPITPFMNQLKIFITSLKNGIHPATQFYGHFARIFESIMRSSRGIVLSKLYTLDPSFSPFYKLLLNHIQTLSIQQLYAVLAIENCRIFSGDDDNQMVFDQLAISAAEFSKKIKGKKYKRITKRYVTKSEYEKLSSEFGIKRTFIDDVGSPHTRKFIKTCDSPDVHVADQDTLVTISEREYKKRKVKRFDYYQKASACVSTIQSIISNSPDLVTKFQNNVVIDKLMETAENINTDLYLMTQIYKLVLLILTSDNRGDTINLIDNFREVFDKPQYKPTQKEFDELFNLNVDENKSARLCYKMPFYFSQICTILFDYFFRIDKSYDEFDKIFYKCFMEFLNDDQKFEILKQDDSKILRCLCQMLPVSPKNIEFIVKPKGRRFVKELPPMTPEEENEMNQPRHQHKPLSGIIWEFAHALTDQKRFPPDQFPYMNSQEWKELTNQVNEYYKIVNTYVSPDEETHSEVENEDKKEKEKENEDEIENENEDEIENENEDEDEKEKEDEHDEEDENENVDENKKEDEHEEEDENENVDENEKENVDEKEKEVSESSAE